MTAYITLREELPHGLWFTVLIPYARTSCPEDRDAVVDDLAEELADLLEATAEDALVVAAVREFSPCTDVRGSRGEITQRNDTERRHVEKIRQYVDSGRYWRMR